MLSDGKLRHVHYLDHRGWRVCRLRSGRRMVRHRARPQLGLQSRLQGRPALIIPSFRLITLRLGGRLGRSYLFVLEMFRACLLGFRGWSEVWGRCHGSVCSGFVAGFCISFGLLVVAALTGVAARTGVGAGPPAETRRANSTITCCRCHGRRPSARRRRSAAMGGARRPNAAGGRFPSWCTGCGRNMSTAFPNIASGRRPARPQHHDIDAGSDAGARPDLQ